MFQTFNYESLKADKECQTDSNYIKCTKVLLDRMEQLTVQRNNVLDRLDDLTHVRKNKSGLKTQLDNEISILQVNKTSTN